MGGFPCAGSARQTSGIPALEGEGGAVAQHSVRRRGGLGICAAELRHHPRNTGSGDRGYRGPRHCATSSIKPTSRFHATAAACWVRLKKMAAEPDQEFQCQEPNPDRLVDAWLGVVGGGISRRASHGSAGSRSECRLDRSILRRRQERPTAFPEGGASAGLRRRPREVLAQPPGACGRSDPAPVADRSFVPRVIWTKS